MKLERLLISTMVALCIACLGACGGSGGSDKDDEASDPIADAGTGNGGNGAVDAGNHDAGNDGTGDVDAGSVDEEDTDAGSGDEGPGDLDYCPDGTPGLDGIATGAFSGGEGYYYDWGDGFWEVEAYFDLSNDSEEYLWVDVNNGDDASTALKPGAFEVGRHYFDDEDGGFMYCQDSEYYYGEADEQSPAACAGFLYNEEYYEMLCGSLKIQAFTKNHLGGEVVNGYFAPWSMVEFDADLNETMCVVPPVSFSFSVDLEETE